MPLVALDVDGTLMRTDNSLSPRNAAAVAAAHDAGWRVVLATGKPPWAVTDVVRRLRLEGPHVVANGSALWRPGQPLELLGRIGAPDVHAALAFGAAHGIPRATSGPGGVFCEAGWRPDAVAAALAEVGEEAPSLVPDAVAAEPDPWKVILILRDGTPHAAPPGLRTARWVRTHRNFLEALPAGASKGAALRELCGRLGVPQRWVAAFGDGENDLEMLRWAGRGVAMAAAAPGVRAAADVVTAGNDDDGVAAELERLLESGWGGAAGRGV